MKAEGQVLPSRECLKESFHQSCGLTYFGLHSPNATCLVLRRHNLALCCPQSLCTNLKADSLCRECECPACKLGEGRPSGRAAGSNSRPAALCFLGSPAGLLTRRGCTSSCSPGAGLRAALRLQIPQYPLCMPEQS